MINASRLSKPQSRQSLVEAAAAREQPYLSISAVALSVALGVFVTALAYSAGRHGYADSKVADYGYWLGQALIFVPASIRLLTRKGSTEAGTSAVAGFLAVAQYLCKVCYSPLSFTYSDELSHWRTAENILSTGKLFTPNFTLPISPQYPGLEEVTTAIVHLTGLPLFSTGLIVAGTAHLLFVEALYLFFRLVGNSQRLAGIAIIIYSSNPDLSYFDSVFAYQTLGLAFFGLALVAGKRLTEARTNGSRTRWATVAMIYIAATVVTHHVTSYILVLTFVLIALASLLARDRRAAALSGALALWAAITAISWLIFEAPETVSYLWSSLSGVFDSFSALLTGGPAASQGTVVVKPYSHEVVAGVAALGLSCLLPLGWWQVRRRYRANPWFVALALGSLTWYVIVVIRLVAADGSELSGRAASFVYIPSAFMAALSVCALIDHAPRLRASAFLGACLAGVLLMSVDGLLNGWPPSWERLPGPHQVGGVERSIGPEEIDIGHWMAARLGPGNRIASDYGNDPMVGTYGNQTPILGDAFLYLSKTYSPSVARQAQLQAINYVLVDLRLTRQLPASGNYFPMDPRAGTYTHPLPLVDMTKFNYAPGVTRIFDSGDIVIYNVSGGY
jgi:hypothetical protein